jgi:hypothetical protein
VELRDICEGVLAEHDALHRGGPLH